MDFRTFLRDRIVVSDGAFGTLLQQRTHGAGTLPERLNIEDPQAVASIHRAYLAAGADMISANTFGANERKTGSRGLSQKLVRAGIDLARREAGDKFVALDIGPIGQLLEPMGSLTFDEAYGIFARMIEAGKGADVILFETMADLQELRAALLAARETSGLPVLCSMTFEKNGRTFAGCDPVCYALTASPLADAVGVNCSLGPAALLPTVRKILENTDKPVIVQANAGLPDAQMRYDVGAEEFAETYETFVREGVRIIGGCCGTTPEYIRRLRALADANKPFFPVRTPRPCVCSASKAVYTDSVRVIGERINPTGKKAMKEALRAEDYGYMQAQALEQTDAGADILDVNAGLPEIDEKEALCKVIKAVQAVCDAPLQIDCGKADAIEAALRVCCGKAIVNSVNGEERSLRTILPVVKKYGAAVVGLTVDEHGVPKTARARMKIAEKIIKACDACGIPRTDIYIDCLTLTASAEQGQAEETLKALSAVKKKYGVRTVLGVSNISFGLPCRSFVNTSFLTAALFAGLDCPILNPNAPENMAAVAAFRALSGQDKNCAEYVEKYGGAQAALSLSAGAAAQPAGGEEREDISRAIKKGMNTAGEIAAKMLESIPPLELIDAYLIPALNEVGDAYEKGTLFLPQLIAAAESAKLCFDEVKKRLPAGAAERGKIVLATVKGDVHDIGKNIAKTVLENYGYTVIDLGKNVPPEEIAARCERDGIRLCGLSALMTTTVPAMEETIRLLRERCPACRVMVGGAVLNEDYARRIGADWYCKDANADVKIAQYVFGGGEEVPRL